jgi:hypothetical protein
MDEEDGRPGHVAPQFGHLSAPSDAPMESLSPASSAQPDQNTTGPDFAVAELRLFGACWCNLVIRSNEPRRLHALPLDPLPEPPAGNETCFGARSAPATAAPLPLPEGVSLTPGEYKPLHLAYPAGLFQPGEDHSSASSVSTQFVNEEKANENVPGK